MCFCDEQPQSLRTKGEVRLLPANLMRITSKNHQRAMYPREGDQHAQPRSPAHGLLLVMEAVECDVDLNSRKILDAI